MTAHVSTYVRTVAGRFGLDAAHGERINSELTRWLDGEIIGTSAHACSAGGLELRASCHAGWYEADVRGRRFAARDKARLLGAVSTHDGQWVGLRDRARVRWYRNAIRLFSYADPALGMEGSAYATSEPPTWEAADQTMARDAQRWVLPRAKVEPVLEDPFASPVRVHANHSKCLQETRQGATTMLLAPGEARLLVVPHPLCEVSEVRRVVGDALGKVRDDEVRHGARTVPTALRVVVARFTVV